MDTLILNFGNDPNDQNLVWRKATRRMTQSKNAPPAIAEGRVFMVESSAKGIRVCIFSEDRVSAHTDEVVNSFPTPW